MMHTPTKMTFENDEHRIIADMMAFRLTITDPSDIHGRREAASQQVFEALEQAGEQGFGADVLVFEPFRAAADAELLVDKEFHDIENGYRVRLGLDPKPWDGPDVAHIERSR